MAWVEIALPATAPDLSGDTWVGVLGATLLVQRVEWWAVRALEEKGRAWLGATRVEQLATRLARERVHGEILRAAITRAGGDGEAVHTWGEIQACGLTSVPSAIRDAASTFEEALSMVIVVTANAVDRWDAIAMSSEADETLVRDARHVAREEHAYFEDLVAWWRAEGA